MNAIVETVPQRLATIEPHSSPGLALLQVAANRGASIEELEKWMSLHERWEANEARKAYIKAMAAFKSKVITVEKSAHVSFPNKTGNNTEYDHETLWDVVAAAVPRMGEYGLAHTWDVVQAEGAVTVSCIVTHEQGHSEKVTMNSPRDESGGKNTIQSIGSATTYLQRYTLKAALGLASKEREDDGRGTNPPLEFISVDQITALTDLAREHGVTQKRFFNYMKVDSMELIYASHYGKAEAAIKAMSKPK